MMLGCFNFIDVYLGVGVERWVSGEHSLYASQNHYYDIGNHIHSKGKEKIFNQFFAGCLICFLRESIMSLSSIYIKPEQNITTIKRQGGRRK